MLIYYSTLRVLVCHVYDSRDFSTTCSLFVNVTSTDKTFPESVV